MILYSLIVLLLHKEVLLPIDDSFTIKIKRQLVCEGPAEYRIGAKNNKTQHFYDRHHGAGSFYIQETRH